MERCTSVPVPHFTRVWRKKPPIHYLINRSCGSKLLLEQVQTRKNLKSLPPLPCSGWNDQSLHCSVSKMVSPEDCSLWLILSERLRSDRRFIHFYYLEVYQWFYYIIYLLTKIQLSPFVKIKFSCKFLCKFLEGGGESQKFEVAPLEFSIFLHPWLERGLLKKPK